MFILRENLHNEHILIVGSGIIGKFNALTLSQLNCKITIADPFIKQNSSKASLGILMGNIYQKRKGRSWKLREESIKLWPQWINYLKEFNPQLCIEKPLIQLTDNPDKFIKMKKFIELNKNENLDILNNNSKYLSTIRKTFPSLNLQGIISHDDGRINPKIVLNTIDLCLKQKNINKLKDELIMIEKHKNQWIANFKNSEEILFSKIIFCNSLDSLKILDPGKYGYKLKPVLGQAIELTDYSNKINFLDLPKVFSINGKNLIPINKNKIIIGSTDEFNILPKEESIKEILNFIDKKPQWLSEQNITKKWYGIRSRPEGESSPILKKIEEGIILCSGFYKNGFLLAPACSNWVLKEIIKNN